MRLGCVKCGAGGVGYTDTSGNRDHTTGRPESELIRDLFLPTPPREQTEGQLKTLEFMFNEDLEPFSLGCESSVAHDGERSGRKPQANKSRTIEH